MCLPYIVLTCLWETLGKKINFVNHQSGTGFPHPCKLQRKCPLQFRTWQRSWKLQYIFMYIQNTYNTLQNMSLSRPSHLLRHFNIGVFVYIVIPFQQTFKHFVYAFFHSEIAWAKHAGEWEIPLHCTTVMCSSE